MTHLVCTPHLVMAPKWGFVFERRQTKIIPIFGLAFDGFTLGHLLRGPNLPIDDLDIIDEWRQLVEYQTKELQAGR